MPFEVDLSKHFKIWFSCLPDTFMPEINQKRLTAFRQTNETITITLIYCSDLLTPKAHLEIQQFAERIQINLFDLPLKNQSQIDKFSATLGAEDKELYRIAQTELSNLTNGGNPAFASDLIRIVFLTKLGNYSDLDTPIDLRHAPMNMRVDVQSPFLYPQSSKGCNNEVLLVPIPKSAVDTEEQNRLIRKIKLALIRNCNEPFTRLERKFQQLSQAGASDDAMFTMLSILSKSKLLSTTTQNAPCFVLRQHLLTRIFSSARGYLDAFGIKAADEFDANKKLQQFLDSMRDVRSPADYLRELKIKCEITMVICISGSMAFDDEIFQPSATVQQKFFPFSLGNSPILAQVYAYSLRFLENDMDSDLSWTEQGKKQQATQANATSGHTPLGSLPAKKDSDPDPDSESSCRIS
jgi:hypothetical protein